MVMPGVRGIETVDVFLLFTEASRLTKMMAIRPLVEGIGPTGLREVVEAGIERTAGAVEAVVAERAAVEAVVWERWGCVYTVLPCFERVAIEGAAPRIKSRSGGCGIEARWRLGVVAHGRIESGQGRVEVGGKCRVWACGSVVFGGRRSLPVLKGKFIPIVVHGELSRGRDVEDVVLVGRRGGGA